MVVVETESASPKMCDFDGDSIVAVAVVAVSLKMWDIFEGDAVARDLDGDVASETRDGDSVSSSSAAEAAAVTTETWSSAPAASSDAGAGAETAETEPADDRDDRVARGWARAGACSQRAGAPAPFLSRTGATSIAWNFSTTPRWPLRWTSKAEAVDASETTERSSGAHLVEGLP